MAAFDLGTLTPGNLRITETDFRNSGLSSHFNDSRDAAASASAYPAKNTPTGCARDNPRNEAIISTMEQVIIVFSGF